MSLKQCFSTDDQISLMMRFCTPADKSIDCVVFKVCCRGLFKEKMSLLSACHRGDFQTVIQLLKKRDDDICVENNQALCAAAYNGHINIVKLMLDRGADIHTNDDHPLCVAAKNGHLDVVKLLLDRDAHVHARDDEPMRAAAKNGHINIVEFFITLGTNINEHDGNALHYSAFFGHSDVVKLLLDNNADINVTNYISYDCSAICGASWNNKFDVVKLLLDRGANIDGRDGIIALILAVCKNNIHIAELLLQRGVKFHVCCCDVYIKTSHQRNLLYNLIELDVPSKTIFLFACANNCKFIVSELIDFDTNVQFSFS